jgi:hypothetical protein
MATMSLTKAEQQTMREQRECPCCGAALTHTQVENLLSKRDDTSATEAFRGPGLPPDESLFLQNQIRLQESRQQQRATADAIDAYQSSWEGLGLSPEAARIAAAGRL